VGRKGMQGILDWVHVNMERFEIIRYNSDREGLLDHSMNHQAKQLFLMKMATIPFPAKF
jgi:hypothetical protein